MIIRYILYNFRRRILAVIPCLTRNPVHKLYLDSRWSLSRTAIRGGNDKAALLKELRKLYILLFAVCSLLCTLCFLPLWANAAPDWQVTLRVEAGTGHNQLVLGADDTAKNDYDYDNVWDVYARLGDARLGGKIQAYFPHSDSEKFWRDIRKKKTPGMTTEWSFVVDSSKDSQGHPYLYNYDFTIRWDLSRVPENYTIFLRDDTTAQQLDMRSTTDTDYKFLYTSARTFKVAVTVPLDVAPPAAPVGLWATTLGKGRIVTLQWSSNAESDIAGYNVYRSLTSGSGYKRINSSLIKRLSYSDTLLKKRKTYYYVVTAVNTSGTESRYSNEVAITK